MMRKLIKTWWVFEAQNAPAVTQLGGQNFVFNLRWNMARQWGALQEVIKVWPRSVCESPVAGSCRPGLEVPAGLPLLCGLGQSPLSLGRAYLAMGAGETTASLSASFSLSSRDSPLGLFCLPVPSALTLSMNQEMLCAAETVSGLESRVHI